MNILIATDAWEPQVNGVVKTLKNTIKKLEEMGHTVKVICPSDYWCFKVPFTKDIFSPFWVRVKTIRDQVEWADYIHISTEGVIGLAVRSYCLKRGYKFTTAYHTDIPNFFYKTFGFGLRLSKKYLRWFHNKSDCVMATTDQNILILKSYGFTAPIKIWSRGVDTDLFVPISKEKSDRIRLVYCGRVSPEKGIEKFLELDNRYEKTIIGDGVCLDSYRFFHQEIRFTGFLHGKDLAVELASHDIFVFPSKFDTFGLVNIEAMSCGLPVACYDCKGAGEIVLGGKRVGCAHFDLRVAVKECHDLIQNNNCREHVLKNYTWNNATSQFFGNLVRKL
jgi:glycosyltransferase involved in cell wall biosynthesis